jgi:uncharacterized protein (UPF0261 family)
MSDKTILVIGTYDTKDDELNYLCDRIRAQGGGVLTLDVSVLGDPSVPTDISKHDIAKTGGSSIEAAIASETKTSRCRSWQMVLWPKYWNFILLVTFMV